MPRRLKSSPNDFSLRLKKLLKERKLTLKEVSALTKIPKSTLHDWTIATVPTDFLAAKRLARELGVSFSYLMTGESDFVGENICELYERDQVLIDGIAEIKIIRLIAKTKTKEESR